MVRRSTRIAASHSGEQAQDIGNTPTKRRYATFTSQALDSPQDFSAEDEDEDDDDDEDDEDDDDEDDDDEDDESENVNEGMDWLVNSDSGPAASTRSQRRAQNAKNAQNATTHPKRQRVNSSVFSLNGDDSRLVQLEIGSDSEKNGENGFWDSQIIPLLSRILCRRSPRLRPSLSGAQSLNCDGKTTGKGQLGARTQPANQNEPKTPQQQQQPEPKKKKPKKTLLLPPPNPSYPIPPGGFEVKTRNSGYGQSLSRAGVLRKNMGPFLGKWIFWGANSGHKKLLTAAVSCGLSEFCNYRGEENGTRMTFTLPALNLEEHRRLLVFLVNNNALKRTKIGLLTNFRYELDVPHGDPPRFKVNLADFLSLEDGSLKEPGLAREALERMVSDFCQAGYNDDSEDDEQEQEQEQGESNSQLQ